MNDQLRIIDEQRTKRYYIRLFWVYTALIALIAFTLGRCA